MTVEIVGDPEGLVYKQYPEGGTVIEKSAGKLILYTERETQPETVTVPDVVGMSAVAANQTLINAGLNIRINGTKNFTGSGVKVTQQSIPAGTEVPRGSVIEVTFLYLDGAE